MGIARPLMITSKGAIFLKLLILFAYPGDSRSSEKGYAFH
jgi:hypothetical protein